MAQRFIKRFALILVLTLIPQNLYAFAPTPALTMPSIPRPTVASNPHNAYKTQIIGLSIGAMQGQFIENPTTSLEHAFANIRPDLLSSLATYGFGEAGGHLGLDPTLTGFLSPVLGSLTSRFLLPPTPVDIDPGDIDEAPEFDEIYYFDEATGQSVHVAGPSDPPLPGVQPSSFWSGLFSTLRNNWPIIVMATASAFAAANAGGNPVNRLPAPPNSTPVIYHSLDGGQSRDAYKKVLPNGESVTFDAITGLALERSQGPLTEKGHFKYQTVKKADGTYSLEFTNPQQLLKGDMIYQEASDNRTILRVDGAEVTGIRIEGPSPNVVIVGPYTTDASGWITEGTVKFLKLGITAFITGGNVTKDSDGNGTGDSAMQSSDIRDLAKGKVEYLLLNGVRRESAPEGTYTSYFDPNKPNSFVGSLNSEGVDRGLVDVVPLFEDQGLPVFVDLAGDVTEVYFSTMNSNKEMQKIKAELDAIAKAQQKSFVPIAYSGGGRPLMNILNGNIDSADKRFYNVDSVVLVASPFVQNWINPLSGIKRVINIYGDEDPLRHAILKDYFGDPNVEIINIELIGGVKHEDYFFNPDEALADGAEKDITYYTDTFIARAAKAASNDADWELFMNDLPEPDGGVIMLDPKLFIGVDIAEMKRRKS